MSGNFPSISTDGGDMGFGMRDPMGTNSPNQSAGGNTKISSTSTDGPAYQGASGYGFMTNDSSMKIQGEAPSGENSSGIPAASPIDIQTYGNPNNSVANFPGR